MPVPLSLRDVRIHGNRVEGVAGQGGGLAVRDALVLIGQGVEIDANTVDAAGMFQDVEAMGGGIFLEGSGAVLRTLGTLQVHDNVVTATQAGGVAVARGGGIALRDGARVDASDQGIEIRDNVVVVVATEPAASFVSGGGLDCVDGTVDLANGDVLRNRSTFSGTVDVEATAVGGGLALDDCSLTIDGTILMSNAVAATGGQLVLLATGGAVNAVASTIAVHRAQILSNFVLFQHGGTGSVAFGSGAGIYMQRVVGDIENSDVSTNVIDGASVSASSVGVGGGLCVDTDTLGPSDVRVASSTISGNVVDLETEFGGTLAIGGGVFLGAVHGVGPGKLVLENTTVSGNSLLSSSKNVLNVGAGVGLNDADASRQLHIIHTTITDNEAFGGGPQSEGGGIGTLGPVSDTVTLQNSLVFGNRAGTASVRNCSAPNAAIRIRGTNFIGGLDLDACNVILTPGASSIESTDPEMGPLADNGGSTQTHAISSTSPARDVARAEDCTSADGAVLSQDQRGLPRSTCDVGAFEVQ